MYSPKYNSISAIICEYNPFHNGHLHHINKTRELTNSKYIIALMSGNFVQRGEPAVFDKFTRTKMALLNGADLVLELPTVYATASSGYFASGAVRLLDKLNSVDYLSFGSEVGNIDILKALTLIITNLSQEENTKIKNFLKSGLSYPAALSKAVSSIENINLLNSPNNILALDYLKALINNNSIIKPVTISREGCSYSDTELSKDGESVFSSASAIRSALLNEQKISSHVPDNIVSLLDNPVHFDLYSDALFYKLLSYKDIGFTSFEDVNDEISNRIIKNLDKFKTVSSFIEIIKSKNYTYTRISRCLLHILLDIKKNDSNIEPSYARILGFKKDASDLLGILKENSDIPLISKLADANINDSLSKDIDSSNLYYYISKQYSNEFTKQIIII